MKEYDVIVIGSGSGAAIVEQALAHDFSVALIDHGPLGGTCLNVGCIPTKALIYPADRIMDIREAGKLGIESKIEKIDFPAIMERMRKIVREGHGLSLEEMRRIPRLDVYDQSAQFVSPNVLAIGKERIKGEKIYLSSGVRPVIPPVEGLEEAGYLTNETVLGLEERPESLVIIGGGYIAAEYAHFFEAMGTPVVIIQRGERLVKDEEPEISELLKIGLARRMDIRTSTEPVKVVRSAGVLTVVARERKTGLTSEHRAERILVAAGRTPNSDLLKVAAGGIETDARGYIKVNEFFETSRKNIWAFGDAIGRQMFRHTANREADLVWQNSAHGARLTLDFDKVPHAVFTRPQIASVGLTESAAAIRHSITVGRARYTDVARGKAMMEEEGFAKIVLERESWRILGFHIVGPEASVLVQEVVNAMASEGTIGPILRGLHIHPALSEVVQATLSHLEES
jgi:dihydrolipoamide dehydrogenase